MALQEISNYSRCQWKIQFSDIFYTIKITIAFVPNHPLFTLLIIFIFPSAFFLISERKNFVMPLVIVVGIILFASIWMTAQYNTLVRLRNRRLNAFADIDVQLRQRHDLVPMLVETVKGYAGHEKEALFRVTEARAAAMSAVSIEDKIKKEQQLTSALQGLKVAMEAYPDLKANQNFSRLQEQLNEIENKLANSRRAFNGATTDYNTAVESFPGNLIAKNFGFQREVFFDLGTEGRRLMEEPPVVKF